MQVSVQPEIIKSLIIDNLKVRSHNLQVCKQKTNFTFA